jgi:hypothetical protein
MTRIVSVAVVILSASALFAAQPKSKEVLKRIDVLLKMYEKEHPLKHFPSTLKEFQQYAAKKGKPLDLTVFSTFEYDRHGTSLGIIYTCKDTGETAAIATGVVTTW